MCVSFNLLAMNYQRVHADARSICVELDLMLIVLIT